MTTSYRIIYNPEQVRNTLKKWRKAHKYTYTQALRALNPNGRFRWKTWREWEAGRKYPNRVWFDRMVKAGIFILPTLVTKWRRGRAGRPKEIHKGLPFSRVLSRKP